MMKKITFCGGGSAGHVMPNIAIYEDLKDKCDISYLGTPSIEKRICANFGVPFYEFDGVKLVRGKLLCNLGIPFKLIKSYRRCKEILAKIRPDLLFCKGGYVCLPAAYAAASLGIPVLTHESDMTAGLANKLIARKCERVLTTFPHTAKHFKNGVCTGSPMRKKLFFRDKLAAKAQLGLDLRPTILVFGGGSGSAKINAALRDSLFHLCEKYNVLHLCGRGKAMDSHIDGYKQIEFSNDMGLIYACADYAVARCGSNSANELLALKIPTLFIPLKDGSRGDQIVNAQYFNSEGLCHVLDEKELNPHTLTRAIENLIADDKLKAALNSCGVKCGNNNIEMEIERIINR